MKKFIATYYLEKDLVQSRNIEAESAEIALDEALPHGDSIIQYKENNVLYRISSENIQMISVKERSSASVKTVRRGRY
ncbi:hypothetical protein H9650_11280 [Psychrobacillus sp. Sa2BUA9]|uniref:DUF4258 domain-containing protein n=1 Tax=Psychrobacillus faecigallinarum TaxID=2762235 RepID=A0ABR8RAM3_9BACI|nr:hypothetical protein [Psychrobacillus faecigallinarum]MBD7944697.1 hypothetical protein [Psychrobacillus faecigallinarum]